MLASHALRTSSPRPICLGIAFAMGVHGIPAYAQIETDEQETADIIVQATRANRRVQDEPIRVEVIDREEIEEKILMTPGNISMLVAETGGVRVQVTSPSLGSSTVRMQGMKGRYTALLADGLPLYGGQASSIGLLQIAPTDLGQVEVIKGAASALYGPTALGGVINLVSRKPGAAFEAEFLTNLTSREGQDATGYVATPIGNEWGASLVGGFHRQTRQDIDGDGWIDVPGYTRWTVRPRLFWTGADGASLYVTVGAMTEQRTGGTLAGRAVPDGRPFPELQDTRRIDAGLVAKIPVPAVGNLHLRASAVDQKHEHRYGDAAESDRHRTIFAEASLTGGSERTPWLAGLAFQRDSYRARTLSAFDYSHDVPAILAQVEHVARDKLTFAGSARLDFHNVYGTRFSPRVSALWKPGALTVRASLGRGFYAPTPFVEETEATGLTRLMPLSGLRAETADTASLDIGYRFGPFEGNMALFSSHLHDAVRLETAGSANVQLVNLDGRVRSQGAELLLRYRRNGLTVTGSYVHVDPTEPDTTGTGRRTTPLTPRNTAGLVAIWEKHDRGRIGIEAYYTGPQSLDDNPYRTRSAPYIELGILGEIRFGRVSVFLNAENILNVRQTRYNSILLPRRAVDGRWTVDAWAPLDGFTLNGGLRLRFGSR